MRFNVFNLSRYHLLKWSCNSMVRSTSPYLTNLLTLLAFMKIKTTCLKDFVTLWVEIFIVRHHLNTFNDYRPCGSENV